VERRFAVHAGTDVQALSCRRAPRAWMLAFVIVSLATAAGPASAAPKRRDAKAAFDRGVAAYKKGDFAGASEALGKSFDLERDVDTLFAWAQAERKLDHCDKAIGLYEKLLASNLPEANKSVVQQKLAECRTIVAQQKPAEPPPVAPPVAPPPVAEPAASAPAPVTDTGPSTRAWYKDPITLSLVGGGVVAAGVGAGFLASASSHDGKVTNAPDLRASKRHADLAKSQGNIGLIATGVGGALVIGGIIRIVMHRGGTQEHSVTGWLSPDGGGLAVTGAY
jgi:tetratricopeptide (TPR) repeat protein